MYKTKFNSLLKNILPYSPLLVSLFFPYSYHFYFIVLLLSVLLLYNNKFLSFNKEFIIISTITIIVFLGSLLRFFCIDSSDIRDFYEVIRFFPILLLLAKKNKIGIIKEDYFYSIIEYYLLIVSLICFMQFFKINNPMISIISTWYNSENHIENSLGISNRALGLSSGPGDNGVMNLICMIILFVKYWYGQNYMRLGLVTFLSVFNILASQSQTSFIAMVAFVFCFFTYNLIYRFSKRIILLLLLTLLFSSIVIIPCLENFRYFATLFTLGMQRHSYTSRGEKRVRLFNMIKNKPEHVLWGWGKNIFGKNSGAMDNEYLFVFLVYGLPVFVLFIIFLLNNIRLFFQKVNYKQETWLYLNIVGLLVAWPSSFFTQFRAMYVLFLFYAYFLDINNKNLLILEKETIYIK